MIVLDASVWVSVVLRQSTNHQTSRHWVREWFAAEQHIHVPATFLPEVAGAVARQTGRAIYGRREVNAIQRNALFRIELVDLHLAEVAASLAAELHLRGADAVYVALAERLGLPLITWD